MTANHRPVLALALLIAAVSFAAPAAATDNVRITFLNKSGESVNAIIELDKVDPDDPGEVVDDDAVDKKILLPGSKGEEISTETAIKFANCGRLKKGTIEIRKLHQGETLLWRTNVRAEAYRPYEGANCITKVSFGQQEDKTANFDFSIDKTPPRKATITIKR